MHDDLHYLSARDALARFRTRALSPVELVRALIARTERVEPRIHAFTERWFERALSQAREAEARYAGRGPSPRPLEGIPVAIKDDTPIAGARTTSGSLLRADHVDAETAPIVERLLEAGAIVHARTTSPEFSCAGVTWSRLWGVTRNPWNPAFSPGGSSGGSAASLAAGTSTLASGSDIWGSIRIPASCCGVVGYKPPYGRVPEETPYNLDPYNHEGPLARTVADCALMQNAIAGWHPRDIATLREKVEIPLAAEDIAGWRVACSLDLGLFRIDPEVARNTERALDVLRDLGCTIHPVDPGWDAGCVRAAMDHLGHLFGNIVARELDAAAEHMTSYARAFGEYGRRTSAGDFLAAMRVAGEMYASFAPILESHDVFVCPTTAIPALPADHDPTTARVEIAGLAVDPVLGWILTWPFNMLSRCPVISVPSGFATSGVPTGIQIAARSYDDLRVFRAAAAYEREVGGFDEVDRRPPL
jgi:amidase